MKSGHFFLCPTAEMRPTVQATSEVRLFCFAGFCHGCHELKHDYLGNAVRGHVFLKSA